MPKMLKTRLASAIALSCLVNVANAAESEAWVDENGNVNERITVRGAYFGQHASDSVKTPTLLVNVPQSLSIMTREQMDQMGLMNVADIVQYTPGVTIGLGEDNRDQMTIRGQNTTADFFIDGLRDDVQYFRPLYNLERVEILRGANALLFGRGGGGGIVNRVTKSAELETRFTSVNANIDSFGAGMMALDFNHSTDKDSAFRVNAMAESIDNHRDFKDGDRFAVNPTYTLNVSDDTQLVMSYEYVEDDRVVDRGIPSSGGEPLQNAQETFFGDPDMNRTTFTGHIARTRVEHRLSASWAINATLQYADYDKLYQNLYSVGFDAGTKQVTLDGYRDTTQRQNLLLQLNAVGQFDTASVAHTVLVGAEYGDQKTENDRKDVRFDASNDDQVTFIFSDPLMIPEYGYTDFVRDRESDVTFTSLFIQDEMEITENLILVGGLRYDRFDIDVTDWIEVRDGSDDGNAGLLGRADSEVSPRLGAIYKPMEALSFYLSYSKSFLPRSGDQFLTLSLSSQALAPEEFENKEVGVKWNVSDSLSLTAALFNVERENGTAVDPSNPERSLITGSETKGFEVQLVGQVNEQWHINLGYSNIDGDEMGRVVDGQVDNRTLAQVPEHMLTLWNRYELNDTWAFALGVIYQSEQYASLGNGVTLPDFTRVDAAAYYQVSDNLQLQLNIENLFDEEYFPSAHNDNNIGTGEPLNGRLSVTYQF